MQDSLWDNDPISNPTPEQSETQLNDQSTPEEDSEHRERTWEDIKQRLEAGTLIRRQRAEVPAFDEGLPQGVRHYIVAPDNSLYHLFAFDDEFVYLEQVTPEERAEVEKRIEREANAELFHAFADIGKQLMDLHLHYDDVPEYPLEWRWNPDVERSWYVTRMRFNKDRTELNVNESLTLAGIPPRCFEYVLGNRSALEWVVDQYRITKDERSGIVSDPNDPDNPEYIARHVCRVVHVSIEHMKLIDELTTLVPPEMFEQMVSQNAEGIDLKDAFQGE